jgi:hypothetical protein
MDCRIKVRSGGSIRKCFGLSRPLAGVRSQVGHG